MSYTLNDYLEDMLDYEQEFEDKRDVISFERCGKNVVTFKQECVPSSFFDVAKELGYKCRVTGNIDLTHEITCSLDEFLTLVELSK